MADAAPERHLFVVFGATGDLMQRKLLPVLYALSTKGKIPEGSRILGVARKPMDDAGFRKLCLAALKAAKCGPDKKLAAFCAATLGFQAVPDEKPKSFDALKKRIDKVEHDAKLPGNRVFYLALPLEGFGPTITGLGRATLNQGPGWTRLVIEKPFGRDLASAEALNALVHRYFDEKQVYRIDHYLGKETVQNLLVFRFANMFIESLWGRERIDHVTITVAESLGVEQRAQYYETSGALRDMIQNHVTQILTLVAMEPPATRDEDSIRNEKVKVLQSIVRLGPNDVVRGQYTAGTSEGQPVAGYRQEAGVDPKSDTETFIALRLKIANWRWQDVPFFVRTGKRLPAKTSGVTLTFKAPPVTFFQTAEEYNSNPDRLSILIQPDEGFSLAFEVKVPGREMRVQTHRMKFHYADVFGPLPDGYETLLDDVILGDPTLFVRADEVEESWKLYDPLLRAPPPLRFYPAGTWGPTESQTLVKEWGQRWYYEE
ncbi:MAG TPA: glucose-6-phosphate dehydrogenase [Thermoplasmata archaeon]|nr:glucose-6-phosphate dehydrogenase [Thermoplasmata archaeon]